MGPRYFEDFVELAGGGPIALGSHLFTSQSIVDFARSYDPQRMHVDEEQARDTTYGGLIASGWHTAATYMRLLVDGVIGGSESLGSPGVENLRWLKPVRPGDTLQGRFIVLEARPSRSRPEWGVVRSRGEMVNQHGELVMQLDAVNFFARRPAST
ncbi:MAG: MaoC family dehydratase [Chloroflexota bacterium]